ncbi:flagellar motor protein MotA [Microbaculum marinisediminis]|uniref:Flagellar motor protein MotA n=1 Tax=Microbaculum marinisediminis TaxID=2931392 RepID=A0AAW5QV02_9HYPH|nr:flagellar motor protein MotA [Microbaculum sp. A6E488]MCT8971717.1 flagellar motor protein MotA [Microbaculum sp. A6E488]
MARSTDPQKLASPQVYLLRMLVFLIIAGFIGAILFPQVYTAFMSNPGLNGLILGVLAIGILMAIRQVFRLFREVTWVNDFRLADPGLEVSKPPVLLAPMAALLRDRVGRMAISAPTMRSILDSIAMRLDESREMARYMTGLLVFLGLLGTFWGLLQTVSSVAGTIQSLNIGSGDTGVIFEDLKSGLQAPLSGMGTAFSSSLFGLAGSLILGFLDLQAGQAQNRFYNDLEDWLSSVTEIAATEERPAEAAPVAPAVVAPAPAPAPAPALKTDDIQKSIDRLTQVMSEGGPNRAATAAMADLAEGIQGLVQHMRSEQKMIREWVEAQADRQSEIRDLLARLADRERV